MSAESFCWRCQRDTPALIYRLRSGHYFNGCQICNAARQHRPYATRTEFEEFTTAKAGLGAGQGEMPCPTTVSR